MKTYIACLSTLLLISIYDVACAPHDRILASSREADNNIPIDNSALNEERELAESNRRFEALVDRIALDNEIEALHIESLGEEEGEASFEESQRGLRNIQRLQNTLQPFLVNNDLDAIEKFCEEHKNDGYQFWITIQGIWERFSLGNDENLQGTQNEASEELGKALDNSGVGRHFGLIG